MILWIGAVMILTGAAGTGICICRERQEHSSQLRSLQKAFEMIAGEVGYSRISLPEILQQTSERVSDSKLGETFRHIAERLCDGSGQDMGMIWEEEMSSFLDKGLLSETERELLLSFPYSVWYPDSKRQQEAVTEFSLQVAASAAAALLKQREENRITMLLSMAFGIFTALILL